jgi:hypothetical protein
LAETVETAPEEMGVIQTEEREEMEMTLLGLNLLVV